MLSIFLFEVFMQKILIADDEASLRVILEDIVAKKNVTMTVCTNGTDAFKELAANEFDVAVLDIRMPGMSGLEILARQGEFKKNTQVIVMTAQDSMQNAVQSMKTGAFDYIIKPFDIHEMSIIIDRALDNSRMREELGVLKAQKQGARNDSELIGKSRVMQDVFKIIGRVADQDVTILVQGESGTGKEMIAKAIHKMGARAHREFVAVNCAAIPEHLLESELFGHRRGAFTGAIEDKMGYLERADHGTIFLDEIGELPLSLQAKLLRFLQEKTIQRVGEYTPRPLDVRVIAASNRRLEELAKSGRFREDLFFRLSVVPVFIPPLRERQEDILPLIEHFMARFMPVLAHENRRLADDARNYLVSYSWPGNVRELENAIKRVLVLGRGAVVTLAEVKNVISAVPVLGGDAGIQETSRRELLPNTMEEMISERIKIELEDALAMHGKDLFQHFLPMLERPLIRLVLEKTGGNQLQAAEKLGINRNTLRKKMCELGLSGIGEGDA